MLNSRRIARGVVRDGVVVPDGGARLPEGAQVDILLPELPAELRKEIDAWERASDEDLADFESSLDEATGPRA